MPTPFRCPLCGCTSYEQIAGANPHRRAVYACCGCSVIFFDAQRFANQGAPPEPERPPGWVMPPSSTTKQDRN